MKPVLISPYFVVKSSRNGRGVFALTEFEKGKTLFTLDGLIISHPTQTSVQIDENKHVENLIASYVNHHCEPNAGVDRNKNAMIALKDIHRGDEITFDYNKNEASLHAPFLCSCCGKMIQGYLHTKVKETSGI